MNPISSLKKLIRQNMYHRHIKSKCNYGMQHDVDVFNAINATPLTESEKQQIKERWGAIIPELECGWDGINMYKSVGAFSADYVPYSYYYAYIIDALNPIHDRKVLTNKGMAFNYHGQIPQPKTVIRCIRGVFFDNDNNIISKGEAQSIVAKNNHTMIIKPILACGAGEGIKLIPESTTKHEIIDILSQYGDDFIVQDKLKQSSLMDRLNQTSLNTMRLTTLLLDDGVHLLSACVRMGQAGSIADNVALGGLIVGINNDGTLHEFGFDSLGQKHPGHNNVEFTQFTIPNFEKCVDLVKEAHKQIATCRIVGWDIALDENNQPVLVEANLRRPGITLEQLCTGPIFGPHTDKVIKLVKEFYEVNDPIPMFEYSTQI